MRQGGARILWAGVTLLHTYISLALAILTCGLAMGVGDTSARRIGAIFLASWIASILVYRHDPYHADIGVLAIDSLSLVGFVWVSLRGRRFWAMAACACEAVIVASHLALIIDLRVTMGTFILSMAMWSYGILLCIAFGTWAGWRARRLAHAAASS